MSLATVGTVITGRFEMDYIKFGEGSKKLVIIPGLSLHAIAPAAGSVARPYISAFRGYTVWLFERRKHAPEGYGVSEMADDTAETMRTLGISDAFVFGASQGGMIAQYLASRHPRLVKGLVLGSTMAYTNAYARDGIAKWIEFAKNREVEALNFDFFEHLYEPERLEAYKDAFARLAKQGTPEELRQFAILSEAVLTFDARPILGSITCPVFVIGGRKDRVLTPEASEELASLLGCPLYMYEDYGHAVYDDAPDYKQRMRTFFESI